VHNGKNYKIDIYTQPPKLDEPTSLDTLLKEIQAIRIGQDELSKHVSKLEHDPTDRDERRARDENCARNGRNKWDDHDRDKST